MRRPISPVSLGEAARALGGGSFAPAEPSATSAPEIWGSGWSWASPSAGRAAPLCSAPAACCSRGTQGEVLSRGGCSSPGCGERSALLTPQLQQLGWSRRAAGGCAPRAGAWVVPRGWGAPHRVPWLTVVGPSSLPEQIGWSRLCWYRSHLARSRSGEMLHAGAGCLIWWQPVLRSEEIL